MPKFYFCSVYGIEVIYPPGWCGWFDLMPETVTVLAYDDRLGQLLCIGYVTTQADLDLLLANPGVTAYATETDAEAAIAAHSVVHADVWFGERLESRWPLEVV